MSTPTAHLAAAGVSIWLDDLSRSRIITGNLADLIVTRNVSRRHDEPDDLRRARSLGERHVVRRPDHRARRVAAPAPTRRSSRSRPTTCAPRADVFRPVYDATDGVDGRVSIEVSPDLAHDTDATIAQAKELWATVDRPNVLIKIPATKAGLPAITEVIGSGISVNVTLIFSLERYAEVIDAYLAGLEQAQGRRHRPVAASTRSRRSSSRASTPRSTSASPRSAPTRPTALKSQGRHRERAPRLRAVRAGVRRPTARRR